MQAIQKGDRTESDIFHSCSIIWETTSVKFFKIKSIFVTNSSNMQDWKKSSISVLNINLS